ncbi:hypothetical protein BDZ89DRAFT_1075661, partial [Hymenopellis radicata]
MSQEHNCYQPLWTSTLEPEEAYKRMWTSPAKGECWRDLVIPLPIKKHKMVEEERRGCMRFFKKPKRVKVEYERETRLSTIGLVSIATLKMWLQCEFIELNTADRFAVSAVERGILHVEWTEDPSEWSARQILELPRELLVGFDPSPNQPNLDVKDERDRTAPAARASQSNSETRMP